MRQTLYTPKPLALPRDQNPWLFPGTVGAGVGVEGSKEHFRWDGKGPGSVVSIEQVS